MRQTEWKTTLTCDRCRKEVSRLEIIYIRKYRDDYPEPMNYYPFAELCPSCWAALREFLGMDKETK